MNARRYLILAGVITALLGIILAWSFGFVVSRPPESARISGSPTRGTQDEAGQSEIQAGPQLTKSRIRGTHRKPTEEETWQLLLNTVIPVVDIPEQSNADRVVELNRLVREQGISEQDLVFVIEKDDLTRERPVSKLIFPPIAIREVPLRVVLQNIKDSTVLHFEVTGGKVELWNYHYLPREPDPPAEGMPEVPPTDPAESDPFAEPDPYAEPE